MGTDLKIMAVLGMARTIILLNWLHMMKWAKTVSYWMALRLGISWVEQGIK
jgi:hypothetical protein